MWYRQKWFYAYPRLTWLCILGGTSHGIDILPDAVQRKHAEALLAKSATIGCGWCKVSPLPALLQQSVPSRFRVRLVPLSGLLPVPPGDLSTLHWLLHIGIRELLRH